MLIGFLIILVIALKDRKVKHLKKNGVTVEAKFQSPRKFWPRGNGKRDMTIDMDGGEVDWREKEKTERKSIKRHENERDRKITR